MCTDHKGLVWFYGFAVKLYFWGVDRKAKRGIKEVGCQEPCAKMKIRVAAMVKTGLNLTNQNSKKEEICCLLEIRRLRVMGSSYVEMEKGSDSWEVHGKNEIGKQKRERGTDPLKKIKEC